MQAPSLSGGSGRGTGTIKASSLSLFSVQEKSNQKMSCRGDELHGD